jgi:hypothetical protein
MQLEGAVARAIVDGRGAARRVGGAHATTPCATHHTAFMLPFAAVHNIITARMALAHATVCTRLD